MKNTWSWIKRIFLVVVIIHVGWFLYFAFTISEDIEVKDSKQNMLILLGVVCVLLLLYFFWFRKMEPL
ncbi:MAG TPA: LPXTG cell wall anchor domain-containing protein, partial [Ferruginibacter sp.]|nr:LPXTG cell wall anchor domain-containing protein [Ferruginibacter sp.]